MDRLQDLNPAKMAVSASIAARMHSLRNLVPIRNDSMGYVPATGYVHVSRLKMRGIAILGGGVAALSFVLGYMVAASGTPVGAVTVPALFGIAVTVFGLVQSPWLSRDVSELIKTAASNEAVKPILTTVLEHLGAAPARVGAVLICFSLGFMGGATIGAKARIDSWFVGPPTRFETTWHKHGLTEPPNAEAAIYWIYLQGILTRRGIDEDQIKAIYLLQAKDWNARAGTNSGQIPPPASTKKTEAPSATDDTLRALKDWLENTPKGNPIADQPPPVGNKGAS